MAAGGAKRIYLDLKEFKFRERRAAVNVYAADNMGQVCSLLPRDLTARPKW